MVLFKQAEDQYENNLFYKSYATLKRIHELQGSYNTRVLYLAIKSYVKIRHYVDSLTASQLAQGNMVYMLQNYRRCITERTLLDSFFTIVDKSNYPQEKYEEMISVKLDVDPVITQVETIIRTVYYNVKQNQARYIHDTIDYYGQLFVDNFPGYIKKNKKEFKIVLENNKMFPVKLDYDTSTHSIDAYYPGSEDKPFAFCLIGPLFCPYDSKLGNYVLFNAKKSILFADSLSDPEYFKYILPLRIAGISPKLYFDKDGNIFNIDINNYLSRLCESMNRVGFFSYYRGDFDNLAFLNGENKDGNK